MAVPLTASRFAANHRLQSAARNNPPMRKGETGEAVRLLQQALLDLGYALPISTANGTRPPDGIYGDETAGAVWQFQTDQSDPGLQKDGIAGHDTLSRLDDLFSQPPAPDLGLPDVPHYELTLPQLGQPLPWVPAWSRPLLGVQHLDLALPPLLNFKPILDLTALPPAPTRPPWLTPYQVGKTGLPWEVPYVSPRPGTPGDVLSAISKVPAVKRAADQLQALGQDELNRVWRDFRKDPLAWAFATPLVLGVGFTGAVAAAKLNPQLPSLPAIPLGLPGLSLKMTYVQDVHGLITHPFQPQQFGGALQLDVTKLLREFR